jgi:hypothetical protein
MSHFSCFSHLKEVFFEISPLHRGWNSCSRSESFEIVSVYVKQWRTCSKFHYFVCNFIEHTVAFYRNCNNSRRPRQKQGFMNSVFQESDDVRKRSVCARSEVLTALLLKIQVLWHVTLYCWFVVSNISREYFYYCTVHFEDSLSIAHQQMH